MRKPHFAAFALVTLGLGACAGPSTPLPAAPTQVSPATPTPTPPPQGGWSIVTTLVGGTGPVECTSGPRVGATATFDLGVDRASNTIVLIIDPRNYPTDHWADYHGSVSGNSVAASGHYYGTELCGGGNVVGLVNNGVPASVTGTFSEDGSQLTAREIRTATSAGKTYTYEYEWKAVLR